MKYFILLIFIILSFNLKKEGEGGVKNEVLEIREKILDIAEYFHKNYTWSDTLKSYHGLFPDFASPLNHSRKYRREFLENQYDL